MTYGGSVPDHHARLLGLEERRHRLVAHHAAHVYDDGHQLEPGLRLSLRLVVHRSRGLQLLHRLRGRLGDRQHGDTDHHRLEPDDDVRRCRAHRSRPLLGLRQQRLVVVPLHEANVLDDRNELEPGVRLSVFVLLHRRGGSQLHHQLRRWLSDRQPGDADHHGIESLHDLRFHATRHHGALLGFQERRQRLVSRSTAHVLDDGHQLEPRLRLALPVHLQRGSRVELLHRLCPRLCCRHPGANRSGRQRQPDQRRISELHRCGQPAAGHRRQHERPELCRGHSLDADQRSAAGWQLHIGSHHLHRDDALGHQRH